MTKAKTRIKTAAAIYASQTREDAAADIRKIGDLSRDVSRQTADMNDEIAAITQRYQPILEAMQAQIVTLQKGVGTWCEANRAELTQDGKTKTANLVTGEVSWRNRPPSVSVRGADSVVEMLKMLKLDRFIRIKEEVNKEAILNEPDAARGIAGVSIVTGVEDFVITPFEQAAE